MLAVSEVQLCPVHSRTVLPEHGSGEDVALARFMRAVPNIREGKLLHPQEEFVRRGGHVCAVDLLVWCEGHEPPPPAAGKDDFHMETVCTLVNIIGNAARSSVKVRGSHKRRLLPSAVLMPCIHKADSIAWGCVHQSGVLPKNEPRCKSDFQAFSPIRDLLCLRWDAMECMLSCIASE